MAELKTINTKLEESPGDLVVCYDIVKKFSDAGITAKYRYYHKSIDNMTSADVYFGRGGEILLRSREIKLETLKNRKINYYIYKNSNLKL